jgi:hypothetical protein
MPRQSSKQSGIDQRSSAAANHALPIVVALGEFLDHLAARHQLFVRIVFALASAKTITKSCLLWQIG